MTTIDIYGPGDIEVVNKKPELAVWFNSMPESNGKRNWTVLLYRKGDEGFDMFEDGMTFVRTEYYDRARYEADCLRYLIGEINVRPSILDYDPELLTPA